MSEWLFVAILTVPLVAFVVLDVQVARKLHVAASIRPHSSFLTLVSGLVNAVTIGVAIGAALGIHSIVALLTGIRILPAPLPTIGIYVAVVITSVFLIPLRRQIGRWEREIPPDPNHRFGVDE